jgi:nucleoside permease NupC
LLLPIVKFKIEYGNKMKNDWRSVIFALIVFVGVSVLLAWPVMMLWNGCLVDAVTGVKEITWLQAWGINFLFGMLFNKNSVKIKE